jgi:hypothetical protein
MDRAAVGIRLILEFVERFENNNFCWRCFVKNVRKLKKFKIFRGHHL